MKEYPSYKNITLDKVFDRLPLNNQKVITSFLRYCEITAGKHSIIKIKGKIVQIADILNKPLDSLELEDVREFLALINQSSLAIATKNDTKKTLKRFLKWKYKNWSSKFADLKDVKLNSKEGRKITKEDLLTPKEMDLIVKNVDSLKYKTILLLMQETANRPEEVLKLRWKDINFDKGEVKLDSAKTGEFRNIPIYKVLEHLKRYRLEGFYETPKAEDFVFTSYQDTSKHLSVQSLSRFLNILEKKINFNRHLYPYLWRHSILSQMIKSLSPKLYEMYAGHSLEVGMNTYAHLDNEDLRKELDKVYDQTELTPTEREEMKDIKQRLEAIELLIKQTHLGTKAKDLLGEYDPRTLSPKELLEREKKNWEEGTKFLKNKKPSNPEFRGN